MAAGARTDDEIGVAGRDGSDEQGQIRDDVAAIAVHEGEDSTGAERSVGPGLAGGTVTSA